MKGLLREGINIWAALAAACFGINYHFAAKPTMLWAIDGGSHAVQFIIFGVILGFWH